MSGPEHENPQSCVAGQVELKLPARIYTGPVFVLREAVSDSGATDEVFTGQRNIRESC